MENYDRRDTAVALARKGRCAEALEIFERDLCFARDPEATSYYAFCLASAAGDFDKAISICLVAAEKEFYNPEIYLNLGRIFLLNGQKPAAIKAFKRGLKFDSGHKGILREVTNLGLRRRPVISFLSRQNVINRYLGRFAKSIG